MIEVRYQPAFVRWLDGLTDEQARARIIVRIRRVSLGNPGDIKSLGGGLHEMRIDHGPGYRVYLCYRGPAIVVLLGGGDKGSQERDILRARAALAAME